MEQEFRTIQSERMGAEQKLLEQWCTSQRIHGDTPFIARLDGRSFHSYTKKCKRPYDPCISSAMDVTARYLIEEFGAKLAYWQSDEITLFFFNTNPIAQHIFNGRAQKLMSVLGAGTSVKFNRAVDQLCEETWIPESDALFDCRVFPVTMEQAVENLIWRQRDAVKNAVTMAAYSVYSHKECLNKHAGDKIKMLRDKGIAFDLDYPAFFRLGGIVYKRPVVKVMTDAQFNAIPEKNRPVSRGYMSNELVSDAFSFENGVLNDFITNHPVK